MLTKAIKCWTGHKTCKQKDNDYIRLRKSKEYHYDTNRLNVPANINHKGFGLVVKQQSRRQNKVIQAVTLGIYNYISDVKK